jgi:hypothetical protein
MNDISGISSQHKLTSHLKVSFESAQKPSQVECALETGEIKQFELQLEQIDHAFTLMREIRASLESALRDLS